MVLGMAFKNFLKALETFSLCLFFQYFITDIDEKRTSNGETDLLMYCRLGNLDKIEKLLLEGANPNISDNSGWTSLHFACRWYLQKNS